MAERLLPLLLVLVTISSLLQLKPVTTTTNPTSPYLSPSLFFPNYQKMLDNFKIFIYQDNQPFFNTTTESLFFSSLLNSPFTTTNANEAHLFYLYFPPNSSYKSISRKIKELRIEFPFWDRSLGADHFYISCDGIGYESDRNLVELKKNSIHISCFPSIEFEGRFRFIPHKDITLPPLIGNFKATTSISETRYIGYLRYTGLKSGFMEELNDDPDFLIESEPSSDEILSRSKFCLFFYGGVSVSGIGKALRYGCVPVVISERPIFDMPFMDVLRWTEIAVFVGTSEVKELKNVLNGTCGERYEMMRELGMRASKHFVWNSSPQPYDAFHMALYQLWMRRHTIRYTRSEVDFTITTIHKEGLINLGFNDNGFTWSNIKQGGENIKQRLDRRLSSTTLMLQFPNNKIQHLIRIKSNHNPFLLDNNPDQDKGPKTFRFQAM